MLITIYDKVGNPKVELSPNDSSTQATEIQGDSVLTLSFTHYEHIDLDVDDYADFEGERYWLTEKYRPKQKSAKEWSYDIKLYGVESMIKRLLVIKTVDNEEEPVFTLTAPPREHVAMIVHCMNDGMGNITDWKVGQVDGSENIVIDYFGKYCDEALREIAEKVGAEYWIEGQTVNVCRCEHGDPITLGYDQGLAVIEPDRADNVKFYTRLYPVGSSRNIDPEKYGYSRLQLPEGKKFVETNADKYGRVDHYEESAFADIYPRRVGEVSGVRSEVKTGEDGKPFTIYYFRDDSLPFDPNDYEIGGLVKRVSFQEGSELAGLGAEENGTYYFEVNYNSETKEFEIITTWPYKNDTQLPGGNLIPKIHDKYILWHIRMPDEYYRLAEEEFLKAVEKYNEEHALDITVFKASTDHVWVEDNNADLFVGRRVRLESEEYFPEKGYRDSRITKITRKVNLPSSMELEIGDALSRSSKQKFTDDIKDVRSLAVSIGSTISIPDIIRTGDTTVPTDNNLFSAKRAKSEFLNKNFPDRAKKKIIFEEGIDMGEFVSGSKGGRIDGTGSAELLDLILRGFLSSPMFADGFAGEGWRVWLEEGLSHLTVDKLTVRQTMAVFELLIEKIRAVGGQICVSAANGKIKTIEDLGDAYLINFEQTNEFVGNDLIRCQTFSDGHQKSYWVAVNDSDAADGVEILKSEFEGLSLPEVGDECVLMGNTTDPKRQSLILISATEDGQPRIDVLDGVHGKNFEGCLRARLGALGGITDDDFGEKQPQGYGLYSDNAYLRGEFILSSGEDVLTRFAATEGKIVSSVDALRGDVDTPGNFIANPMFAEGMEGWEAVSEPSVPIIPSNEAASQSGVEIVRDEKERPVLRIRDSSVSQGRDDMRGEPDNYPVNAEGKREPATVYLSFLCRSSTGGRISAKLTASSRPGFAGRYTPLSLEEQVEASEGYTMITASGLWNGRGSLVIEAEGEAEIYMVTLSEDKAGTLSYHYSTLFEQSDKLIKLSAENFNADGTVIEGSYIEQTANRISLSVKEEVEGKLQEIGINIESGEIELRADNVTFTDSEGNVQAFIEGGAVNAKAINADSLTAGQLEMYEKNTDGTRAAHPTVRITPESRGMTVHDKETGETRQEFSGVEYADKSAFFGDGSSGDLNPNPGGRIMKTATASQPTVEDVQDYAICSAVEIKSSATIRITSGKIQAYAKAVSGEIAANDPTVIVPTIYSTAEASVSLVLRQYSDAACTTKTDEWEIAAATALSQARRETSMEDDGGSDSGAYIFTAKEMYDTAECAGRSVVTRSGGYVRLFFVSRIKATRDGSTATASYGYYAGTQLKAEYVTDMYVARYFGNGFCLGDRADDYILAMLADNGMRFEARNGTKGLRMTPSGGMEVLVAADATTEHWAPVPRLVCRTTYTWNASGSSYVPAYDGYCIDGHYPTVVRRSTGKAELTMHSNWTTLLGTVQAKNLRIRTEGRNTSGVYAAITGVQDNKIYVSLQNQTGAADGSFHIEIGLA